MKKIRTKDAAESVLRELPSVLGVRVREDVNGHPREVHVLVGSGPNVRDLALDIRELLEERLGIPVDQRVISIAQIAPGASFGAGAEPAREAGPDEAETGGLGGDPAEGGTPEAEKATPGDAEPRTASVAAAAAVIGSGWVDAGPPSAPVVRSVHWAGGAGPMSSASRAPTAHADGTSERGSGRLYFVGRSTVQRNGRISVAVRIALGGAEFTAESMDLDSDDGRARAAASAALDAAAAAAGDGSAFHLEGATLCRTLDRDFVLVTALGSLPRRGRAPVLLAGIQEIDADVETAAALAALKASNRILDGVVGRD